MSSSWGTKRPGAEGEEKGPARSLCKELCAQHGERMSYLQRAHHSHAEAHPGSGKAGESAQHRDTGKGSR